jgi:Rha family phage regulatory protein
MNIEITNKTVRDTHGTLEVLLAGRWVRAEDAIHILKSANPLVASKLEAVLVAFHALVPAPTEPEFQPQLTVRDGAIYANSREVAEAFGKEHKNVLRDIRTIADQLPQEHRLNFEPVTSEVTRPDGSTISTPTVDMTRDGLTLLVMGFTGEKALKFKLAYINAFNKMEEELRARPVLDLNNPEHLLPLLAQYAEDKKRLAEQVTEMAPKALVHDRIVVAGEDIGLREAANVLDVPQKKFMDFLRGELGWVYRQGGKIKPMATTLRQGWLVYKENPIPDKQGRHWPQVYVTPLGLSLLAQTLSPEGWGPKQ